MPDFSQVEVIVFDLDDTLCGYWDAAKAGLLATFQELCPAGQTPEAMVQHWAAAFRGFCGTIKKTGWYEGYLREGEPTRTETMRLTLERIGIHDDALARKLSTTYMTRRDEHLKLFPEALDCLKHLSKYSLGLLTNGPADIQRQEVQTTGIAPFFTWIWIEGELGYGKPDPRTLETVETLSGCSGEQILFVGNSFAHDILPAIQKGWKTAWVRRPSDIPPSSTAQNERVEERPHDAPAPDLEIENLSELCGFLTKV